MNKKTFRIIILLLTVVLIFIFNKYNLQQYLTLEYLKSNKLTFQDYFENNKFIFIPTYMFIYILCAALSIPGVTILTLAGGALFGLLTGTILVSFASTIGATLALLVSRFVLRDYVQNNFKDKLGVINRGIEKEGVFYLLTLRLIPIFPFFLINLIMGLTPIKTGIYFIVSQLGMLPGTLVYVNAGVQLSKIDSLQGLISFPLLISFALIGILPFVSKKIVDFAKAKKVYKKYK